MNEHLAAWKQLLRQGDDFYLYMLVIALALWLAYRSMSHHVWKRMARIGLLILILGGMLWGLSYVIDWPPFSFWG